MKAVLCTIAFFVASAASGGEFDGAWALSGKWTGYMGLALRISGDRYKYWFSSDVGPTTFETTINGKTTRYTEKPPRYPLTGRIIIRGDVLELRGAGEYYDRKWHRIVYRGVPCLLADEHYREWRRTGRLPDDRLLFRIPQFDERHPQLNYGGVERADGSVSRASPLPPK
ncbi:MAG: hypothetical protein QOH01_2037 [Verrucomicrobiota bacterium]|jgi:hypothetical protein